MVTFEVRVELNREFVLPDKYTGGETRHIITDVFETKVLLVKQFDIEVWE